MPSASAEAQAEGVTNSDDIRSTHSDDIEMTRLADETTDTAADPVDTNPGFISAEGLTFFQGCAHRVNQLPKEYVILWDLDGALFHRITGIYNSYPIGTPTFRAMVYGRRSINEDFMRKFNEAHLKEPQGDTAKIEYGHRHAGEYKPARFLNAMSRLVRSGNYRVVAIDDIPEYTTAMFNVAKAAPALYQGQSFQIQVDSATGTLRAVYFEQNDFDFATGDITDGSQFTAPWVIDETTTNAQDPIAEWSRFTEECGIALDRVHTEDDFQTLINMFLIYATDKVGVFLLNQAGALPETVKAIGIKPEPMHSASAAASAETGTANLCRRTDCRFDVSFF